MEKIVKPGYLEIPSLDAYVEVTGDDDFDDEYLSVTLGGWISFLFTRDGSRCIEIWDIHTGEETIFEEDEVGDAIKEWYSAAYEKRVLPTLREFLKGEKNEDTQQ